MKYAPDPTAGQLAALRDELAPGGEVRVERRILGGLGCTMDVLAISGAGITRERVILRRYGPWFTEHQPRVAEIEFAVLGHLNRHGVPAPEPLWIDRQEVFPELASIIGFIDARGLSRPDDPIDFVSQLARMLARLHAVPLAGLPDDLSDFNASEVARFSATSPPPHIKSHRLGSRLWASQRGEVERIELDDRVFLHGDYWPGNSLWKQQNLVAIVDFEEVGVGDPALDVATAAINFDYEIWPGAADRFVEVYRSETGRALDSLRFWKLKELSRPMPDIARWLPSFEEFSSRPKVTAEELRADHERLILDLVD